MHTKKLDRALTDRRFKRKMGA